jgi:cyanate lyase
MTRAEVTAKIRDIKRQKDLTWKGIAAKIDAKASPIFITAALLGQMPLLPEQAKKAAKVLGLSADEGKLLAEIPYRGQQPEWPPTDRTIYRFYELIMVYGPTWKELIHEEFGDGIMSAIDFDMTMERMSHEKGDRVKLGMTGKFLSYKRY